MEYDSLPKSVCLSQYWNSFVISFSSSFRGDFDVYFFKFTDPQTHRSANSQILRAVTRDFGHVTQDFGILYFAMSILIQLQLLLIVIVLVAQHVQCWRLNTITWWKEKKIPINIEEMSPKKVISSLLISTLIAFPQMYPVDAFGPINMELKVTSYKPVELCNGKKPIMPGQKAAEGLFPVCVEVEADVTNPEQSKTLTDVAVYGFVREDNAGNSVLPNNPDFRSDAGQYAIIKEIKPGNSHVKYQFVAAVSADPKRDPLPKLTFLSTKAISFPGGDKFKPLSDCELDPRSCDDFEDD